MSNEMQNKVMMVTGATNGIGLESARVLAARVRRSSGWGAIRRSARTLRNRSKRRRATPESNFSWRICRGKRKCASWLHEFKRKYNRLDVLLNNAGAYFASRETNADGQEMTWALNHLNYFLLTNELLDVLKASAPARIVNVSSGAHAMVKGINFADVEYERGYNGWTAYGQSKLANVMFTYELARRLTGTNVTANVLHPGFVATGFGHNNGGLMRTGMNVLQKIVAKRVPKGAQTSVYLASSPEVAEVTGKYFVDSKATRSSAASYDVAAQQRLWELSEQMVGERAAA